MSDNAATVDAGGKTSLLGRSGQPSDELRARHGEGSQGHKRGRPVGSKTGGGQASKAVSVPTQKDQGKTADFVYSKVGKAFRAIFNIMAVKTNCTAWLLEPAEEKDLGESFGDLLLDVGLADSTAVKCVFAAGTLIAVAGTKAISYQAYVAMLNAQRKANAVPTTATNAASAKSPVDEKVTPTTIIPETKAGNL